MIFPKHITIVYIRIKFLDRQRQNQFSKINFLNFLKINIEVTKETYTWIICHRTTVINHTGHLKNGKGKEKKLKMSHKRQRRY